MFKHVEKFVKTLDSFGIHEVIVLGVLFVVVASGVAAFAPWVFPTSFALIAALSPVWLPVMLGVVFWKFWVQYVQRTFINKQDYILLEVRLPKDIMKTPTAMEAVFAGLHQGPGETTLIHRNWMGRVRPWFSFELVSVEGRVRFCIWTRKFFRKHVEAQIYGQYPGVEIHEVEDYTKNVHFDPETMSLWGCDFKLTKADPYPLKTYIDYGLHEKAKEEEKTDPLASVLEFLGSIGKGEQVWIQIIIRTNKDKRRKGSSWFDTEDRWKSEARDEIVKIRKEGQKMSKEVMEDSEKTFTFSMLSKQQEETITALERSISKNGFDVGMRGIYFAEKDKFNPIFITGLAGGFKQFSSGHLNGIMPTRWLTKYDYPWQDFRSIRQNRDKRRIIDAYRRRAWFFPPFKTPHFILNTEELATLYHFPGQVAKTPTLARIPSTRGEAPHNLPI